MEVSIDVAASTELETWAMAVPRPSLAEVEQAELAELEQLWQTMDLPGHRIELIDAQIVVSPTANRRHSNVVTELMDQLAKVKRRQWERHTNLTAQITATRERLIPDLMVAPADAPECGDSELLSSGLLLVAEVVSPSSRREDRDLKVRAYAQGGVPLYLLIDYYADPPAVTLFSEPGERGYARKEVATAGQALRLPAPFSIALDPARLLS